MFLVGNNYERATFKVLRKLQLYYGNEIEIELEKPVTDIGKKSFSRDPALVLEEIAKDGSQSILIPDFILRFPQFPPELRADIIVETMYFRGPAHRIEKTKSILMMKETLACVKSVNHDFCFPDHISQKERDNAFIAEMRRAIERRLAIFGRGVGK
jgi:predicted DNA-binding antitoxin AbrB/MazE fold protein